MAKVTMPQLGESVAEGTIGKWLKKPGDHVAKYEPLLEVITDKVNAEVPSPVEGVLREILVEEGQTVPNNAEIAVIETAEDGSEAAAPTVSPGAGGIAGEPPTPQAEPEPAAAGVQALPGAAAAGGPATGPAGSDERAPHEMPERAAAVAPPPTATASPSANGDGAAGDANARMTPAVRRLLREHGLSPEQIVGTGHAGRITRDDVLAFVEAQRTGQGPAATAAPGAPPAAPSAAPATAPTSAAPTPAAAPAAPAPSWAPGQDEELVPFDQMRRGIAAQMTRAGAVPVAYTTFECDMTSAVRFREANKAAYQGREGIGLSYVPFVMKAVVEALKKHPDINAHYSEQGLIRKRRINLGVAVAVDNGLIVPVVHDADQLSINGLNRAVADLAARARANRLRLDDLQGGTFTVDNTGWFGSLTSSPIINAPQICILTMEAVRKRPVVLDTPDGEVIAVRSLMNICVGFDHRATDGAQTAYFVQDVIRWLESVGPDTPIW
ncbi:MAG TPA: dihydrolipoamide acetyltransferase family protein [Candidatus Limnocylindrales bacterium]